ncbi:hypothetical protein V5030_00975 [Moellerella wisconsensis]|uniref:hypothetical protein n=1 Tax=Moellerella wisconsensis TaxID=158849 RepID=UPI003075EEA1
MLRPSANSKAIELICIDVQHKVSSIDMPSCISRACRKYKCAKPKIDRSSYCIEHQSTGWEVHHKDKSLQLTFLYQCDRPGFKTSLISLSNTTHLLSFRSMRREIESLAI